MPFGLFGNDDEDDHVDSSVEMANKDYDAIQLTDEMVDRFQPPEWVQEATRMRPYKEDGGITSSRDILSKIHSSGAGFSWELAYGNVVDLRVIPENMDVSQTLRTQLKNEYANSDFEQVEPDLLDFKAGRWLSGVKLTLRRYGLLPIENAKLTGWDTDPLGGITSEMSGLTATDTTETDVVVQIRLEPADRDWSDGFDHPGMAQSGFSSKRIAYDLNQPTDETRWIKMPVLGIPMGREVLEHDPGPVELMAADIIEEHAAKPAWKANVYIFAMSTDETEVKKRVRKTAQVFNSYYQSDTKQGFKADPLHDDDLLAAVDRGVRREFEDTSDHFTDIETTSFFHLPKQSDMPDENMVWAVREKDGGVPATSPSFEDYDDIGYYSDGFPRSMREWYEDDTEWPYAFTPADGPPAEVTGRGHELLVNRKEGEATLWDDETTFMGAWPAAMVENHKYSDGSPYFIGTDDNGREVPILQKQRRRHILGLGLTGSGKSTAMNTIQTTTFNRGAGGIVIDPGGEDTYKQLMALDPSRYDDVIIMDCGSDFGEYQVGMNMLETYLNPGDPGFHAEVDATIDALLTNIGADEYPRMEGIASHVFRGLIEADYMDGNRYQELKKSGDVDDSRQNPEDEKLGVVVRDLLQDDPTDDEFTYTPEDAQHILATKENREEWHRMMKEQEIDHLIPFSKQLAKLDNDDSKLEPLLRRLKKLTESPNFRPLVAQRKNTINLPEIIMNGKILYVKADSPTKKKRQMICGMVALKAWQTILNIPTPKEQRRMELAGVPLPGDLDHDTYDGFTEFNLTVDELHSVITPQMDLEHMLAEARKREFCLFLLTQQVVQIPPEQRDELVSNLGHVFAWDPGNSQKEKNAVSSMFPDVSADDLKLGQFKAWTMITDAQGDISDAFVCHMFGPVPAQTDFDSVHELMTQKEQEYGVHVDDIGTIGPPPRFSRGETIDPETGDVERLDDETKHTIIETVYALEAQADADRGHDGVLATDVKAAVSDRIDVTSTPLDNLLERIEATGSLAYGSHDGQTTLTVTDDGLDDLFSTGRGGSGGKIDHRRLISTAFKELAAEGLIMRAPLQDGGSLPDAVGRAPVQQGGASLEEARKNFERFRDDYPVAFWATGGDDEVRVEAESKGLTHPDKPINNWAKATRDGYRCLFVVDSGPDDDPNKNAKRLTNIFRSPACLSERSPAEIDPERSFYSGGNLCVEGDPEDGSGVFAMHEDPGADLSWVELDGRITLWEREVGEVASFNGADHFAVSDRSDYPAVYHVADTGEYVVWDVPNQEEHRYSTKEDMETEWKYIKEPSIPELVFSSGTVPDWETLDILVSTDDGLQYYDPDSDASTPLCDVGAEGNHPVATQGTERTGGEASGPTMDSGGETMTDGAENSSDDDDDLAGLSL